MMIKGSLVSPSQTEEGLYQIYTKETLNGTDYEHCFYDVTAGESYFVSGSALSSDYPVCVFYDAEGNKLQSMGAEARAYTNSLLKAPANAVKLVVNQAQADGPISVVSAVTSVMDYDLDTAAQKIAETPAFSFKPLDDGYVTFVFDDLCPDVDNVASVFEEYGYPVVLAAPTARLDFKATGLSSANGNYTPGMRMRDIMAQVVADGGEIMAHNFSVVTADNQDDYEFMYKYFVKTKQELENAGFNIRGLIRAGGTGQISETPQIEKWLIGNYEYANMGTAENYKEERITINQDQNTLKSKIASAKQNHEWVKIMGHSYDYSNYFTSEADLRSLLDYCREQGVRVVTYAYMNDTFGQFE